MEGRTWIAGIAAFGVLLFGVLIAAQLVVSLVKAYVAVAMGSIALGFGGSHWTSDIAKNYLKMVVATGMELMALQMLVGIGINLLGVWSNIPDKQFGVQPVVSMVIGLIFLFVIMKEIPSMISGIVFGMQFGGGGMGVISSAISAGFNAASMAAGGVGLVAKAGAIAATAQGMQGSTIGNIANAATQTFKDNIGKPGIAKQSMMGGTMGNLMEMKQKETQPKEDDPSGPLINIPEANN